MREECEIKSDHLAKVGTQGGERPAARKAARGALSQALQLVVVVERVERGDGLRAAAIYLCDVDAAPSRAGCGTALSNGAWRLKDDLDDFDYFPISGGTLQSSMKEGVNNKMIETAVFLDHVGYRKLSQVTTFEIYVIYCM